MSKVESDIAQIIREYHSKTGKFVTIGSVESATGGRIADKITNVAGSSDYFWGSLVSYSNLIKINVAGVKENTLNLHGAVSSETACEMAEGGRKLLNVDVCISTTGIAGPGGATPIKPVGLFYMGLASQNNTTCLKFIFTGNREQIKEQAAQQALKMVRDYLQQCVDQLSNINLEEKHVVTCFLEHDHLILILRRSKKVGTYQRAWAGVSGYLDRDDPLEQAYTEIREETGLFKSSVKLIKQGIPIEVIDKSINRKWIVHPFLFHVTDPERLRIDWEHTEFKWIKPDELTRYNTVPGLKKAFDAVTD